MPPATAWGWNPQPLAAGSAYATYSAEATKVRKAMADRLPLSRPAPGRRQLLLGRRAYAGWRGRMRSISLPCWRLASSRSWCNWRRWKNPGDIPRKQMRWRRSGFRR